MVNEAGLPELIAAAGGALTPAERRIAETILDDPTVAAFATVAELAVRSGTSGPSVIRFSTKLGFDGYGGLQERARAALQGALRRPRDRIRQPEADDTWEQHRQAVEAGVDAVFEAVGPDWVRTAAARLVGAPTVWLAGAGSTLPARTVLATGLRLLRPETRHLDGPVSEIAVETADVAAGDVAIVLDFPRYERAVVDTAVWLADGGAEVIAITDGPLSPLAELADLWCGLPVRAVGPFDTAAGTVALAEVLVAEVAHELRDSAIARLDAAEVRWADAGIFLDGTAAPPGVTRAR